MKEYFSKTVHQWKADYAFQTIASSAVSAFISLAYIIYNGILGKQAKKTGGAHPA